MKKIMKRPSAMMKRPSAMALHLVAHEHANVSSTDDCTSNDEPLMAEVPVKCFEPCDTHLEYDGYEGVPFKYFEIGCWVPTGNVAQDDECLEFLHLGGSLEKFYLHSVVMPAPTDEKPSPHHLPLFYMKVAMFDRDKESYTDIAHGIVQDVSFHSWMSPDMIDKVKAGAFN